MKVYVVNCNFNVSRVLIDCAFKKKADAKAYAEKMNNDKEKAIARCKEIIVSHEGESMVKFLVESHIIEYEVESVDLK